MCGTRSNILGGRRKIVVQKTRYAKLKASCTYSVTVTCIQYDTKGKPYTTTCQESRSGTQDQAREKVSFYNQYRILFDGQDLINVAVFKASSPVQTEDVLLSEESCD